MWVSVLQAEELNLCPMHLEFPCFSLSTKGEERNLQDSYTEQFAKRKGAYCAFIMIQVWPPATLHSPLKAAWDSVHELMVKSKLPIN